MAKEITQTECQEENPINEGRRRLLTMLAASSGAIAASMVLPEKWVKPVVDWGVLPVHAAVSPTLVLDILEITLGDHAVAVNVKSFVLINGTNFDATIHYIDSLGRVTATSGLLFANVSPCGPLFSGQSISSIPGASIVNGTPFAGFIGFPFGINCNSTEASSTLSVQLGVGTDRSNIINGTIPSNGSLITW